MMVSRCAWQCSTRTSTKMPEFARPEYVDLIARHVREIAEIRIDHVRELDELRSLLKERALVLAAESAKWRTTAMMTAAGLIISVIALVAVFLKR